MLSPPLFPVSALTSGGSSARESSSRPTTPRRHRTPPAVVHAIQMAHRGNVSPRSLRKFAPHASLRSHRRFRQLAVAASTRSAFSQVRVERMLVASRAYKLSADHLHVRQTLQSGNIICTNHSCLTLPFSFSIVKLKRDPTFCFKNTETL